MIGPQFTALSSEHQEYVGIDDVGSYNYFSVSFDLDLHDADPDKPITARLQAGSPTGGDWQDIPSGGYSIPTLSYSGSGGVWSGVMAYDMAFVEWDWEHGELGALMQMRVACDYTLTDGTSGTVYSTDIKELYAYTGGYLTHNPDADGNSGKVDSKGLDVTFRVQKDLILDPDKLEKVEVVVYIGNTWIDMDPDKLTMFPMTEEGILRLTCPLADILGPGEPAHSGSNDEVLLVLHYKDEDKGIDWSDGAWARVKVRNMPTVELDPYLYGPYGEGAWYPTLFYTVTLNDLKGGTATASVYIDTGDGFYKAATPWDAEYASHYIGTYDPAEEPGDTWKDHSEVYLAEPADGGGIRGVAKIVFDIVYPDGETDQIETETRPVFMGFFAKIDKSYGGQGWIEGERTDSDTGDTLYTMSFDLIIDTDLMDPAMVEDNGGRLSNTDAWKTYHDPETEIWTDESGICHMRYTFVSNSPFVDGEYTFYPSISGWVDENNLWEPWSLSYDFLRSSPSDLTPPAFVSVSSSHDHSSGSQDRFRYAFDLELNDADPYEDVVVSLQYADIGSGNWETCPSDGDSMIWVYHSPSESVWHSEDLILDTAALDLKGAMGLKKQVRLAAKYKLSDGTYGLAYSTDLRSLYIFTGDYIRGESAEMQDGKITAKFRVDKGLVPDSSKLTIVSCAMRNGEQSWELSDKAVITGSGEDGICTVSYTLNGESLDLTKHTSVALALHYQDYGGAIDWDSCGLAVFYLRGAPTLEIDLSGTEGDPGYGALGILTLNDLEGGTAVFRLLCWGYGGFLPIYSDCAELTCVPGDETGGKYYAWLYDPYLEDLSANDSEGARDKSKIVVEYTYADGTKGSLESAEFEQYGGRFVSSANDPPFCYDEENKCLVMELAVNLSLVEMENISITSTSARRDTWTNLDVPTLADCYAAGDGTYRMIFKVPLETLEPGSYSMDVQLTCYNGKGPRWKNEVYAKIDLG